MAGVNVSIIVVKVLFDVGLHPNLIDWVEEMTLVILSHLIHLVDQCVGLAKGKEDEQAISEWAGSHLCWLVETVDVVQGKRCFGLPCTCCIF